MNKLFLCCLLISICNTYGADETGFNIPGGKFYIKNETVLNELIENVTSHLETLSTQSNNPELKFIRNHLATYKVTAGIVYELYSEIDENGTPINCTILLWEKPWLEFVKFTVECGDERRKYEWIKGTEERRKRQISGNNFVLGGLSATPESEYPKLHLILTNALEQLKKDRDDFELTMHRVVSSNSQVVAGNRYQVTIETKTSTNVIKECTADIWERTWLNFLQVDLTCQNKTYQYLKQ